jgi:NitT/TauT family transport system permease protein
VRFSNSIMLSGPGFVRQSCRLALNSMQKRISTTSSWLLDAIRPQYSAFAAAGSILLVWEAAGRFFEIHPEILPTPSRILLEIWEQAPKLQVHGLSSAYAIFGGFLIAVVCSAFVAALIGLSPAFQRVATPIFTILHPAPLTIAVPLIFVWAGYGLRPEIWIAFLLSFVTITMGAVRGFQSLPQETLELLVTMGASRSQVLLKARVPASLPSVFASLKLAVPLVAVGTTAGEFAQAETGIGYLLLSSAFKMETPLVFAALTVLGLLALLMYGGITLLERILIPWHVEMTRSGEYFGIGAFRD